MEWEAIIKLMSLDAAILNEVLELEPKDRAELARHLILSLETAPPDNDADEAWAQEAENRAACADAAPGQLSDWQSALERIRSSLKQEPKK